MGRLILISGAARSGKSIFAEKTAARMGGNIAYLATAEALDEEMTVRIDKHKEQRPSSWQTFEEPLQPCAVIEKHQQRFDTWLLDCITLYISNLILSKMKGVLIGENYLAADLQDFVLSELGVLIDFTKKSSLTLIAVTNEVGWGIVPADALSRAYADIVGKANQKLAAAADEVYLVTMGIPIKLKPCDCIAGEK